MKIAYKCGMGNAAFEQVEKLSKNHEVVVFTLKNKVKNIQQDFKIIWLKPLIRFRNSGFCPSLLWKLKKFDIIQLHYPFYGVQEIIWLGKILGILKKPKLVIYYHHTAYLGNFFTKIMSLPTRIIKNSLFKHADKIACSTIDYVKRSSIKKIYQKTKLKNKRDNN